MQLLILKDFTLRKPLSINLLFKLHTFVYILLVKYEMNIGIRIK
jgi:hypothetical protein